MQSRVGKYAISTVDFDSFSEVVQKPVQKKKQQKESVFPLFEQCSQLCPDPFWSDKFRSMAKGKFPPKSEFRDGILSYRKATKAVTVEVPSDPYAAIDVISDFFRSNMGIFSSMDKENSVQLHERRMTSALSQPPLTWKQASKKVQGTMLSYFVMEMKENMKLSDQETEQLRQTIKLAIGNKIFTKENIIVDDNRIQCIEDLMWNEEERSFFPDPEVKPQVGRSYSKKETEEDEGEAAHKDTMPQFALRWKKYVDSLDKKICRISGKAPERSTTVTEESGTEE